MNLEDYTTKHLAAELVAALTCEVLNSEGKRQSHDWGDPHARWGWQRWYWKISYPVRRKGYQECVRCRYVVRRLR